MAKGMANRWLLAALVLLLVTVLVVAWIDGGREPVGDIVQPIAVPEPVR